MNTKLYIVGSFTQKFTSEIQGGNRLATLCTLQKCSMQISCRTFGCCRLAQCTEPRDPQKKKNQKERWKIDRLQDDICSRVRSDKFRNARRKKNFRNRRRRPFAIDHPATPVYIVRRRVSCGSRVAAGSTEIVFAGKQTNDKEAQRQMNPNRDRK